MASSPLQQVWFDRSRTAQDDFCPASRYWGVEYGGIGLAPQGDSDTKFHLPFGSAVHKGMESLAKGLSARDAYASALESLSPLLSNPFIPEWVREEKRCMLAGFVIGYARSVFPFDLEEYDIIAPEKEVVVPFRGGSVVAKPDWIRRRKSDKTPWYKEFKTASQVGEDWLKSWARSAQLLTGALAIEHLLGEPLKGSVIQGLYKGGKYKGRSTSIFCVAYRGADGALYPKWARGLEKVSLWEQDFPIEDYVESLPVPLLLEQFPATPPIMFNREMMERWLEERLIREKAIANVRSLDPISDRIRQKLFPMHTGGCEPAYSDPCPFVGLCYNPQGAEEPLSHGYTWRTPHLECDPAWTLINAMNGNGDE